MTQSTVKKESELSPEAIMKLGMAYWSSKVLLSAVELGVFSVLAAGPLDGETLRQRLGLHPRGAAACLDALVSLGMLQREGDKYSDTPEAELFLDRSKPVTYMGGILEMANTTLYQ